MTKTNKPTDFRKVVLRLIARRARSAEDAASTTAAARRAYEDLAVVLVPLVSQQGFDALVARAFQLAQREYPAVGTTADNGEQFTPISLWLDRQDQHITIDAAAAMFAALAGLLIALIGESLTTRYLQKAWPEGFSAAPKERQT